MRTLLILRHAKSSWKNDRLDDHDRPLNQRGKVDAPRIGKLLHRQELTPDLIITSSAERALATAELVALNCDYDKEIEVSRALYHGAPDDYVQRLLRVADDLMRVMVVGHNPGLETLLTLLTDEEEPLQTAALAQVELPIEQWGDLKDGVRGTLVNVWRPRELA